MRRIALTTILVLAALLAGVAASGCSQDSASGTATGATPTSSAFPSALPITPSPASDWKQTETYANDYYGFSFQYDPTRFEVKELEKGASGGFTVFVYGVDDQAKVSSYFCVAPLERPSFLHHAKPSSKEMTRLRRQFFGAGQAAVGKIESVRRIRLCGLPGWLGDGTLTRSGQSPAHVWLRLYVLVGPRCLWELLLTSELDEASSTWSAYEGVIASFRAE